MTELEPRPFVLDRGGFALAGEAVGEGRPIVLAHGLTATRRYVVHGSRVLPRNGFEAISYDARGHGESDPAPAGAGYAYPELIDDLAALLDELVAGPCVLAGHSMGAHTLAGLALRDPARIAALVLVEPAYDGAEPGEQELGRWERLAEGLDGGGVEGFVAAYDDGLDPASRETLIRIARERLSLHRHPNAVARALRECPRSRPFEALAELQRIEVPALVVASHDDVDASHPYAVAAAWASSLAQARLVSEERGQSPLAWQGGRLSREIAAFCEEPRVAERLAA